MTIRIIILSIVLLAITFLVGQAAYATPKEDLLKAADEIGKLEKAADLVHKTGSGQGLETQIIGQVIGYVMGIVGSLALLIFIYGGIMWMMSEGAEEQVKKAQKTMVWAALGMVAIFLSYAVLNFYYEFAGTLWGA